jgi:hypothetical protein
MNWFKECSKISEFILILTLKEVVLIDISFFITLIERKGVSKKDRALDYEVSTVLPDTTVCDESKDLYIWSLNSFGNCFSLFALEYANPYVVSLDMNDEVMQFANRAFALLGTVLLLLRSVYQDGLEGYNYLRA